MTVLVLDAAAVVDLLLRNRRGATVADHLVGVSLFTVAHLDAEVLSAMARLHREGQLTIEEVSERLDLLADLDMQRLPITPSLLTLAWELRDNVVARDALYVAAAIALRVRLLTTDARLARAIPDIALDLTALGSS